MQAWCLRHYIVLLQKDYAVRVRFYAVRVRFYAVRVRFYAVRFRVRVRVRVSLQ